ncbi:MAG: hypothetical protein QOD02_1189, partial [Mycobacterium sp.]|nr:hypothetical protein [Mycobacterium sp.]
MPGPVEYHVASQIRYVVLEIGRGVGQYLGRGVQAADHEVARLGDLRVLEIAS